MYCEAKINNKWTSIDFYQESPEGQKVLVPVLEGRSAVGSALRWHGICSPIDVSQLSDTLIKEFGDKSDHGFETFPCSWFRGKNLNLPEYSGFVLRQVIHDFESGDVDSINEEGFLSADEYNELEPEVKLSYRYYEWTEPWGIRDVMRRIEQGINARIFAFNWSTRYGVHLAWDDVPEQVSLDMARVIVRSH